MTMTCRTPAQGSVMHLLGYLDGIHRFGDYIANAPRFDAQVCCNMHTQLQPTPPKQKDIANIPCVEIERCGLVVGSDRQQTAIGKSLRRFYAGIHYVSAGLFQQVMGSWPSTGNNPRLLAVVTHDEAMGFCESLSRRCTDEPLEAALPTSVQMEHLARGEPIDVRRLLQTCDLQTLGAFLYAMYRMETESFSSPWILENFYFAGPRVAGLRVWDQVLVHRGRKEDDDMWECQYWLQIWNHLVSSQERVFAWRTRASHDGLFCPRQDLSGPCNVSPDFWPLLSKNASDVYGGPYEWCRDAAAINPMPDLDKIDPWVPVGHQLHKAYSMQKDGFADHRVVRRIGRGAEISDVRISSKGQRYPFRVVFNTRV